MIQGLTNSDAIPALERLMQFAGARQRLIANNVANLSTPGFRPTDVSVKDFQDQLAQAIDAKRAKPDFSGGGQSDGLSIASSDEVEVFADRIELHPSPGGEGSGILFHDENDRDLDRTMQKLVENFTTYRTAAQFLRNRFDLLNTAIRERI